MVTGAIILDPVVLVVAEVEDDARLPFFAKDVGIADIGAKR